MKENKEKTTCKKDWFIRGVDIEAINAVSMAAKKSKKRLGQWLSEVILKAAKETLTKTTEVAKPEDVRDVLKEFVERFESRQEKLEKQLQMLGEPWHKRVFRRKE